MAGAQLGSTFNLQSNSNTLTTDYKPFGSSQFTTQGCLLTNP